MAAGFWLGQVEDMDQAIEPVKRCPNHMPGPGTVETRPLMKPSDFKGAPSDELTELEEDLRDRPERR